MQHAKKMVLVDPKLLEGLRTPSQPPTSNASQDKTIGILKPETVVVDSTVQTLDQKMNSILNNKSLTEEQKAQLYSSFLQEYLTMKRKQTQVYGVKSTPNIPLPVLKESPEGISPPPPHSLSPLGAGQTFVEREVIKTAPKHLVGQAQLLLERIRNDPKLE